VRARFVEKREVAKGTLLVLFDLLGREVEFKPSQYFFVTLLDPPYEDELGARRHFSVVTSPNERERRGFCTRLRDSAFKRSLVELPTGAEVELEEPKGSFLLPQDTNQGMSTRPPLVSRERLLGAGASQGTAVVKASTTTTATTTTPYPTITNPYP